MEIGGGRGMEKRVEKVMRRGSQYDSLKWCRFASAGDSFVPPLEWVPMPKVRVHSNVMWTRITSRYGDAQQRSMNEVVKDKLTHTPPVSLAVPQSPLISLSYVALLIIPYRTTLHNLFIHTFFNFIKFMDYYFYCLTI